MNEPLLIAMLFAILALSGVEPGQARVAKMCSTDAVAQFWTGC